MGRRKFGSVGTNNGNSWWARYTRNGQWQTPGHTFSDEDAAWQWLRAEQSLIDRDLWTPPADRRAAAQLEAEAAELRDATTVAVYARKWIENRVTRKGTPLHPSTREDYLDYVDGILTPLADRPVAALTAVEIAQWHGSRAATPSLRHKAYSFLKSVLKTAVEVDKLIDENPCQVENAARKPRPTSNPDKQVKALTHPKVVGLADLVQPRDRLLVLLEAYCCIRTGEGCALRRLDVEIGPDDTFGWLTVERGISSYDGQRHEGDTKTGSQGERVVPIPPHLIPDVKAHLDQWAEPGDDGLLFPSSNPAMAFRTTQQINGHAAVRRKDGSIRKRGYGWYHARQEAGLPTMRLHWLRHWGATLWDEAGTPEAIRRAILGHAQPGMTGHYTHPDTTKASPYALKVSQLAGWKPPTSAPSLKETSTNTLANVLGLMNADALADTLAALNADQLAEVVPLLPADKVAAVVASLAVRGA